MTTRDPGRHDRATPRAIVSGAAFMSGAAAVDDPADGHDRRVVAVDRPDDEGAHPFAAAEGDRYAPGTGLGEGGMGTVELAHDRRLRRDVALKSPRPGVMGAAARMAQEAWITAQLEHPGIVPVYDAGRRPDGTIFYAMRLVRGRSLEDALAAAGDLAARLGWLRHLLAACEAVAFAHGRGIVHRDLKPDNILVGELGETQVADWGVACPASTGAGRAWDTMIEAGLVCETALGSGIGTPSYMSPEQSAGAPAAPTADVWSLGVVLYRMLAGVLPFEGTHASEVIARVREAPLPRLPADVPRELAAIALRALERDPARRYPSARELAADVASFLDGRRVAAHSYSTVELLRRLVRAWRVPLAVAGVALVVLVIGAIVAVDRVVDERDRALDAEDAARRSLASAILSQAEREAAHGQMPEAELLAAEVLALGPSSRARGVMMAAALPRPEVVMTTPFAPCAARIEGPGALAACLEPSRVSVWSGDEQRWSASLEAAFAGFADRDALVVVDRARVLHRLAVADGHESHRPLPLGRATGFTAGGGWSLASVGWHAIAIPPDGGRAIERSVCRELSSVRAMTIAETSPPTFVVGCDDGTFASAAPGGEWTRGPDLGPEAVGLAVTLSPDGARVATVNERGVLTIARWPDGAIVVRRPSPHRGPRALAFSADGAYLAIASEHGAVAVLDAAAGRELHRLPHAHAFGVRWVGAALTTTGHDRRLAWRLPAVASGPVLVPDGAGIGALATDSAESAPGRFAIGRGDGAVELWSLAGEPLGATRVGDKTVKALAFGRGAVADLWVAAIGRIGLAPLALPGLGEGPDIGRGSFRRVGALADGTLIAASYGEPPVVLAPDGAIVAMLGPDVGTARDLEVAADGLGVAVLEDPTSLVWWYRPGRAPEPLVAMPGAIAMAVRSGELALLAPDRVLLVVIDPAPTAPSTQARFDLPGPTAVDIVWSPDGRHLAIAHGDGSIRVVTRGGDEVARLDGHTERVGQLASTPTLLLSAGWDGSVRRWAWAALEAPADALVEDARRRWALDLATALDGRR